MENADKILFRCSSLGHIMNEPKKKSETISQTAKKHLVDVYVSRKYGRETNIHNRYTAKGLAVEEDSLTLYSRYSRKFHVKNEETIFNGYICGTPDIIADDKVIDIKSSWDIFTYFRTKIDDINDMYYWQLMGYMWLTGRKSAELAYCLVNTPDQLVNDQKRRLMWSMGLIDETPDFQEACEKIDQLSKYDDIPLVERCNIIKLEYDQSAVDRIIEKVTNCRQWMNETLLTKQLA